MSAPGQTPFVEESPRRAGWEFTTENTVLVRKIIGGVLPKGGAGRNRVLVAGLVNVVGTTDHVDGVIDREDRGPSSRPM